MNIIEYDKQKFINNIIAKIQPFEEERKKRLLKLLWWQIVLFLVTYGLGKAVVFFIATYPNISVIFSILAFFSFIAFICNFGIYDKDFKQYLKRKCNALILKKFNLDTIRGIAFSNDILKKSNLFSTYSYQEPDDVICGCYDDVNYKIAETTLVAKTSKSTVDVFKGVIISFPTNKFFKSETLITSKGDENIRNYPTNSKFAIKLMLFTAFIPAVLMALVFLFYNVESMLDSGASTESLMMEISSDFDLWIVVTLEIVISLIIILCFAIPLNRQRKKMQEAKFEDIDFDNRFNVYTKDQVEARYLLTPSFMERLKSVETSFGTKGIKCSFFEDTIMLAIPTNKDLFELGSLYCPIQKSKEIAKTYDQIKSIQKMIKHFKLNERAGL